MDQQSPKCPVHGTYLEPTNTQYGMRWDCPIHGCTVVWWQNENTTPADLETRRARSNAHTAFAEAMHRIGTSKANMYRALKKNLDVDHIGLCDVQMCVEIIEWARNL